jgi:hypothetical protein
LSRAIIGSIGVMPMPPAISTVWAASSTIGKLFLGAEISTISPARQRSWIWREPPRLVGERWTPIS